MGASTQPAPATQLHFSGTLTDILDRVEYRRVDSSEHFDPVYRLRYEAYRREEWIPFNSLGTLRDEFDDQPNSMCYGVYIDGSLVSSLRLHHLTPGCRMSPAYSVFTDVLDPLLDQGLTFIDPTRFTADYEASLAYPALPFLTLRLAVMATINYRVTICLHSIRPEHVAFYRRVFDSYMLADQRFYHGLSFPMELWGTRAAAVYDRTMRRYPFFHSTTEERSQLFGPPHRSPLLIRASARAAQQPLTENA